MKYYIASGLGNQDAVQRVRDFLKSFGHEITYDWTAHGPVWTHGSERCKEVLQKEIRGVLDADIVIVLWPGGRGTHFEMGAAIVAEKPIIFYSSVEGHHFPSPDLCVFYLHPLITHVKTWDALISTLEEL